MEVPGFGVEGPDGAQDGAWSRALGSREGQDYPAFYENSSTTTTPKASA